MQRRFLKWSKEMVSVHLARYKEYASAQAAKENPQSDSEWKKVIALLNVSVFRSSHTDTLKTSP